MKLEFTGNASARMADRGIREAEVEAALTEPDQLVQSLDKHWLARKQVEGRRLEVLFTRDLVQALVVTAYWQGGQP